MTAKRKAAPRGPRKQRGFVETRNVDSIFSESKPANEELPPEFSRIANEARAAEGEQIAADAPPPPPPPIVDYAGQAKDLVSMCAGMLLPFYPELEPVWTQPKQDSVANALTPVLAKYELQVPDILAKWAPELGLAIVVIPLAIETRKALALAALERAKKAKEAKPAPPPNVRSENAPPYHQAPEAGRGQFQVVERTDPTSLHLKA
jgi:hypothetical protein